MLNWVTERVLSCKLLIIMNKLIIQLKKKNKIIIQALIMSFLVDQSCPQKLLVNKRGKNRIVLFLKRIWEEVKSIQL